MKPQWLFITAFIFLAALIFILWQMRHETNKGDSTSSDTITMRKSQATIDSLRLSNEKLIKEINSDDILISYYVNQADSSKINADKETHRAKKWEQKYQQNKTIHDTVSMINTCDTLLHDYEDFREYSVNYMDAADSAIGHLIRDNTILKTALDSNITAITNLKGELAKAVEEITKITDNQKKVKKGKVFWQKVGLAALGGLVISFLSK